ncbi:hypothetical protein J6590_072800 [Homalodisca vitripennis]|nr:hypothetical protein J6590_072800 [Homalodisca vitripennis]
MSVLLVLLYAVCLLLLTMYLRFRWEYRHVLAIATKLPCPPTLPIIGNAHLFFGDITADYAQSADRKDHLISSLVSKLSEITVYLNGIAGPS